MTKYEILINFITENAQDIFIYAFHCNTPEKATDFIGLLYKLGFRWDGDDFEDDHFKEDGSVTTKWDDKGRQTCYSITPSKIILFGKKAYYESQGKTIISYDDFFKEAEDLSDSVDEKELKHEFKSPKDVNTIIAETGKLNDSGVTFEEVAEITSLDFKYCPECGNKLKNDGQKFCMECGYAIPDDFFIEKVIKKVEKTKENVVDVDAKENAKNEDDIKKTNKKFKLSKTIKQILIIAGILLAVIILIVVVKVLQANIPNNFGLFSSNWQPVAMMITNTLAGCI